MKIHFSFISSWCKNYANYIRIRLYNKVAHSAIYKCTRWQNKVKKKYNRRFAAWRKGKISGKRNYFEKEKKKWNKMTKKQPPAIELTKVEATEREGDGKRKRNTKECIVYINGIVFSVHTHIMMRDDDWSKVHSGADINCVRVNTSSSLLFFVSFHMNALHTWLSSSSRMVWEIKCNCLLKFSSRIAFVNA